MEPRDAKDRDTAIKRLIDDVRIAMSEPDFWPMFALFFTLMAIFVFFFWMALGYDSLSSMLSRWRGACRKLGNWQSMLLFVSPFALGIAFMLASGELISQIERRNRFGKRINWRKVGTTFGVAVVMLGAVTGMMLVWC